MQVSRAQGGFGRFDCLLHAVVCSLRLFCCCCRHDPSSTPADAPNLHLARCRMPLSRLLSRLAACFCCAMRHLTAAAGFPHDRHSLRLAAHQDDREQQSVANLVGLVARSRLATIGCWLALVSGHPCLLLVRDSLLRLLSSFSACLPFRGVSLLSLRTPSIPIQEATAPV